MLSKPALSHSREPQVHEGQENVDASILDDLTVLTGLLCAAKVNTRLAHTSRFNAPTRSKLTAGHNFDRENKDILHLRKARKVYRGFGEAYARLASVSIPHYESLERYKSQMAGFADSLIAELNDAIGDGFDFEALLAINLDEITAQTAQINKTCQGLSRKYPAKKRVETALPSLVSIFTGLISRKLKEQRV